MHFAEYDPEDDRITFSNSVPDGEGLEAFRRDVYGLVSRWMSPPVVATITLEGTLKADHFMESDLYKKMVSVMENIEDSKYDEIRNLLKMMIMFGCNFGTYPPNYKKPQKERKSNRGRKKKEKVKKYKNSQGSGDCFNSQLTIVLPSDHPGIKPYQFKIFRTFSIQLPGARPYIIHDIFCKLKIVVAILDFVMERKIEIVEMHAPLRNYKFTVTLPPHAYLDIKKISDIIADDFEKKKAISYQELFRVQSPWSMVMLYKSYSRDDSKLIFYVIPSHGGSNMKPIFVKITRKGKVNIHGSNMPPIIAMIYAYLDRILDSKNLTIEIIDERFADNIDTDMTISKTRQQITDTCYPWLKGLTKIELMKVTNILGLAK